MDTTEVENDQQQLAKVGESPDPGGASENGQQKSFHISVDRREVHVERQLRAKTRTVRRTLDAQGNVIAEEVVDEQDGEEKKVGGMKTVSVASSGDKSLIDQKMCTVLDNGTNLKNIGAQVHLSDENGTLLQSISPSFQQLLNQKRDYFVDKFPAFKKFRTTPKLFDPPEGAAETILDGDKVITIRRSQAYACARRTTRMINGVVTKQRTRAFVQYAGADGGFQIKMDSGESDEDSEIDELPEPPDRKSIAPSEIGDDQSSLVLYSSKIPVLKATKHKVPAIEKAWHAAKELVDTEERYVNKLHLLHETFMTRIQKDNAESSFISRDKINSICSNLSSLHTFHVDHLLPPLLERRRDWRQQQKIADVIKKQAPFFKLYTEYANNFKRAMHTFEECRKKNKKFRSIVMEIEQLPECEHLPLISHLITPVQRVMRYQLLLQEYKKHLPVDHVDFQDTTEALQLVLSAAAHANDIMKKLDRYKDVISVQELLGNQINNLLTPTRELCKQGALMKISARTGEHQSRYLFLFNDMLLLCSERRMLGSKYKIRAILSTEGMEVCEGDRLETDHTFYIRAPATDSKKSCSIELYAPNAQVKSDWTRTFLNVINETKDRLESFSRNLSPAKENTQVKGLCHICKNEIKKMNICLKCKHPFCEKCLSKSRRDRCIKCEEKKLSKDLQRRKTLLKIKANDSNQLIHSGYLLLMMSKHNDKKKEQKWTKRFFAISKNLLLYMFKSEKDSKALTALPLPGCTIDLPKTQEDDKEPEAKFIFTISHNNRTYQLMVNNEEEMAKWMVALELAANAEIPNEKL